MATPLSIHNLIHGGLRTVLSVVGISIAIILIFMQLGFLGAVFDTAVVFYDEMEFDLIACSPDYYNFVDSGNFEKNKLHTIESASFVNNTAPVHVSLGKWNYEAKQVQRGMLILGIDPMELTFTNSDIRQKILITSKHDAILVDRSSRPRFLGPNHRQPFNEDQIGLEIELNGVGCQLAGLFDIGTGLAADGSAIVNENLFRRIVPGYSADRVGIGLIQLKPGADLAHSQKTLQQLFPGSSGDGDTNFEIEILTRSQIERRQIRYWQWGTPVGFIFVAGVIVAFLVGAIIVYIVLSADIAKQISEYATLKAMGYKNRYLSRTVLEQALILSMISYVCALAISLVLYGFVGSLAKLPLTMTFSRIVLVLGLSILMSCISAMIALKKLREADPADLF